MALGTPKLVNQRFFHKVQRQGYVGPVSEAVACRSVKIQLRPDS